MEFEKLKSAAETVVMPEGMKRRIARNCAHILNTRKETVMKTNKNTAFFRKPAAVFAAAAVCLSLSVAALATGAAQGFFRNLTNWKGAVVGTSYEQAADEIDMTVTVNGNELTVLASFADPQAAPYSESETLGIAAYRIVDADGKTVKEGACASAEVVNGQAAVCIPLDGVDSGSCKLIVTAFVSGKKADQPLNIHGIWEAAFTR